MQSILHRHQRIAEHRLGNVKELAPRALSIFCAVPVRSPATAGSHHGPAVPATLCRFHPTAPALLTAPACCAGCVLGPRLLTIHRAGLGGAAKIASCAAGGNHSGCISAGPGPTLQPWAPARSLWLASDCLSCPIFCGLDHVDGKVFMWGSDLFGQLGMKPPPKKKAAEGAGTVFEADSFSSKMKCARSPAASPTAASSPHVHARWYILTPLPAPRCPACRWVSWRSLSVIIRSAARQWAVGAATGGQPHGRPRPFQWRRNSHPPGLRAQAACPRARCCSCPSRSRTSSSRGIRMRGAGCRGQWG